MNLIYLITKEILYKKINGLLILSSIIVAIISLISSIFLISGHQQETEERFLKTFEKKEALMLDAEDQYRKSTKDLGFNVLILPKDQNLNDFYSDDFASKYMPEEYVNTLANNKIVTVRHLLPSLKQKIHWKEQKRTVILIGTRGEVPIIHKNPKKPLQQAVNKGEIILGHLPAKEMKSKIGDSLKLLGKTFKVSKIHLPRGNKDDITIWISLSEAQELLNKKDLINAILALECKCAWANIEKIKKELEKILPNTQVVGLERRKAKSRKEIRTAAENLTKETLQEELNTRKKQLSSITNFTNILIPGIIFISAIWIGFLMLLNVRERRYEIGVLRAIGVNVRTVMMIYLGKACLLGIVGGIFGIALGLIISYLSFNLSSSQYSTILLDKYSIFIYIFILTPILTIISSWIPVIIAIQEEPATILKEE